MNPPYTIHLHKKPHLSYLICIQTPVSVLIPFIHLIQHFAAQLIHRFSIRLDVDSRQRCAAYIHAADFLPCGQQLRSCFLVDLRIRSQADHGPGICGIDDRVNTHLCDVVPYNFKRHFSYPISFICIRFSSHSAVAVLSTPGQMTVTAASAVRIKTLAGGCPDCLDLL